MQLIKTWLGFYWFLSLLWKFVCEFLTCTHCVGFPEVWHHCLLLLVFAMRTLRIFWYVETLFCPIWAFLWAGQNTGCVTSIFIIFRLIDSAAISFFRIPPPCFSHVYSILPSLIVSAFSQARNVSYWRLFFRLFFYGCVSRSICFSWQSIPHLTTRRSCVVSIFVLQVFVPLILSRAECREKGNHSCCCHQPAKTVGTFFWSAVKDSKKCASFWDTMARDAMRESALRVSEIWLRGTLVLGTFLLFFHLCAWDVHIKCILTSWVQICGQFLSIHCKFGVM